MIAFAAKWCDSICITKYIMKCLQSEALPFVHVFSSKHIHAQNQQMPIEQLMYSLVIQILYIFIRIFFVINVKLALSLRIINESIQLCKIFFTLSRQRTCILTED